MEQDSHFIHFWQKKKFVHEDDSTSKETKADNLRYFLGQFDYIEAKKR